MGPDQNTRGKAAKSHIGKSNIDAKIAKVLPSAPCYSVTTGGSKLLWLNYRVTYSYPE